jgi:hypothetical protein
MMSYIGAPRVVGPLVAPNDQAQYIAVAVKCSILGFEPIFAPVVAGHVPLGRHYVMADVEHATTAVPAPIPAPPLVGKPVIQ